MNIDYNHDQNDLEGLVLKSIWISGLMISRYLNMRIFIISIMVIFI